MFYLNKNEFCMDVSIPAIFFDIYLPIASGNQLKVYLLGYKHACIGMDSGDYIFDNKTISNAINISEDEVVNAWRFWETNGVVKIHETDSDFSVEFLDIKEKYITTRKSSGTNSYSASDENIDDISSTAGNAVIRNTFDAIEMKLGRPLVQNESVKIISFFKKYDMDEKMILKAFHMSFDENGKFRSFKYMESIIIGWYDNSITNLDELEKNEEKRSAKRDRYKTIFQILGFFRDPTDFEKETIDKWFDVFNYGMDIINYACSKTITLPNPNIKYINSILENWHKNGLASLDEIYESENEYKNKRYKQNYNSPKKNSGVYNTKYKESDHSTKFSNFEQSLTNNYSDEDFEEMIKIANKSPSK